MQTKPKHIVIDARIRRASTGRPVDRLLEYLPLLDKDNHYTILLEADDDWISSAPNIKTKHVSFRQFSFNPWHQISFGWLIYKLKPDLVHFTLNGTQPLFYFGNQTAMTHDLTMLSFVRAGRLPGWLHEVRMIGYRLLFWSGNKRANRIIVPTNFVAKDLKDHYRFTSDKTTVIYESSEPPLPINSTRPKGINNHFILHVGSPFPHKNIDRLVEAFTKLKPTYPDLQLVLAGKKEFYFNQLAEMIEKTRAQADIHMPGFVSDPELKWLYENAQAYVLPSLSEGFGLPGLEAMAHGCPLVSSDATCLPEVYGDAAHYFDPLSVDDMAQKIGEVLSDSALRQALIKKGNQQLLKYSWKRMAEQTLAVFEKALKT